MYHAVMQVNDDALMFLKVIFVLCVLLQGDLENNDNVVIFIS